LSVEPDQTEEIERISLDVPVRVPTEIVYGWPKKLKSRRRLFRSFDRWYKANEKDFLIKLRFLKRTDERIDFSFVGVTSIVKGCIFQDEIAIEVIWSDESWDFLMWIETYPIRIACGFVCSECDPEVRPIVPTREMLWRIELFDEFRDWVNHTLAAASQLHIKGEGGMTSARLID
jgi:hypothetical protein